MEIPVEFLCRIDIPNLLIMAALGWILYRRIDSKFEKVDQRFTKIDEKFERMEAKNEERFSKIDETLTRLDKGLVEVSKDIQQLNMRVGNLESKVNGMKDKFSDLTFRAFYILFGINLEEVLMLCLAISDPLILRPLSQRQDNHMG